MTTTSDHAADRPEDWAAPGAALVRSAATDAVPPLADLGRVHIMGIAGSGMSALARILDRAGDHSHRLRGARVGRRSPRCGRSGRRVTIGHSADHIEGADSFVYTTAINPRHPEFVAARESGKPFLRRAAALAAALEGTPHDRHRRYARQDHDHLAADGRRASQRPRPVVRDRGIAVRERRERPSGQRRSLDRRGR